MPSAQPDTSDFPTLSPAQTAAARSRLYVLFAALYRQGLTADLLPALADLPGLAEHLPDPFDGDEAAAAHFRLFGMEIPPHASLFLDPAGLLGGPVAEDAAAFYGRVGFAPDPAAPGPDALSQALGLLAFLAGAEADAWEDGKAPIARRMADLQAEFLAGHLLPWLPPLVLAVQAEESPFYSALAQLTLELSGEQLEHRTRMTQSEPNAPDFIREYPLNPRHPRSISDLLEDEATGLREIAGFLTSPPRCGVYLSREAVARIARSLRLPRGFGTKAQTLETLLRSAVQYEQLPGATAALHTLFDDWHARYAGTIDAYPHLQPFVRPWLDRCDAARALLRRLGEGAL